MKSIYWTSLTCILWVMISSCNKDYNTEIEAELQVYFDKFVEEASVHGMEISFDNIDISGYIQNIEERGTLGQCKTFSNGSKQVVIDQPYWNRVNDIEREYLVFHELGHCLLGRKHLDNWDENGSCTSIMQSGDGNCKGIYNLENRSGLLEELFGL